MTYSCYSMNHLEDDLHKLSDRKILTFGMWQFERMIPCFLRFCSENRWSGASLLKGVSSVAWRMIEIGKISPFKLIQVSDLEDIAPDTEDFSSPYTSAALDAVTSAQHLISYISEKNSRYIVSMSRLCRETVDIFIQSNQSDLELEHLSDQFVGSHPLMLLEIERQKRDMSFLENLSDDEHDFLRNIIARSIELSYESEWLR